MNFESDRIESQLPLKPVVFHILLALAEQSAHGYGVIRSVRKRSDGRIHLQTGAFYRHLKRLLDDGLVVEAGDAPPGDDPRRGSYYRLTDLGLAVVQAERQRMARLVASTKSLGALQDEGPA